MKAQARFTFEKIDHSQDKDVHLVVGLSAPKLDAKAVRPSICIVPCIDVSGSMQGAKLDYAKKSVLKLIDHLQPGDYCGLVTFAYGVTVLSSPVEMTQATKDTLRVKVGELHANGGTNFSGGMLESLSLVEAMDLPNGVLKRVIMFTDGCANQGPAIESKDIVALLKGNKGTATVSAFGYGADADMALLNDVVKTGNGNFAFIKNPDDALSAFAKELGGLLSTHAQNIRVEVRPHGEHTLEGVISDVDSVGDKTGCTVEIPDLLAEETRNIVFAMKIAKQPKAFPRASSVVDVKISYETIGEDKKKQKHTEELKGKLEFVKAGDEDVEPIKEVMELAGVAILVQQQIAAEELAKQGHYSEAELVMNDCARVLRSCKLDVHASTAGIVGSKVSSAGEYKTSGGFLNSLSSGGNSAYHVSSYDPEAHELLRGMNIATSNSSQDAAMSSFTVAVADAPAVSGVVSGNGVIVDADNVGIISSGGIGVVVPADGASTCWVSEDGVLKPDQKKPVSKKKSARW